MPFLETSAKSSDNVEEAFVTIATELKHTQESGAAGTVGDTVGGDTLDPSGVSSKKKGCKCG